MNQEIYESENRRGDVLDLLEDLKEKVETAKGVLLSQNCMVNREYFLHVLGVITNNLPDELKQARWLIDQQHQVIQQARQEADSILADTESRAVQMINEHEITLKARELAEQMIEEANQQAAEIQHATLDYAREKLDGIEDHLTAVLVDIRKDKQQLGS